MKSKTNRVALAGLLMSILVLTGVLIGLTGCAGKAPTEDEIRARVEELLTASGAINDIFFGEGLPVYARDSASEEDSGRYAALGADMDTYEYVREDSPYRTIEEIKAAAEAVYSRSYLEALYEIGFVGYADETVGTMAARYYERDGYLFKSMAFEPLVENVRTYDVSTLRVEKPSGDTYVNFSLESECGGETERINLSLTKQDGEWYLDSPTY